MEGPARTLNGIVYNEQICYNIPSMTDTQLQRIVIGRAEYVDFPELGLFEVPARIDTGARTSSVWASSVKLEDGKLKVVLFGEQHRLFTGEELVFDEFDTTVVANSTGHAQHRYKVQLLVVLKGKRIRAWFTLADRSTQVYPVLIGRNVMLGKFVVDVKQAGANEKRVGERPMPKTDDSKEEV